MVIKAQLDLFASFVAVWVIDFWQSNKSDTASACVHAVVGMSSERNVRHSADLIILYLPQPLGSFPHLCPEGAVRLSGGSQLHLGDSEAGLQEDTLPGKSVWSVQSQLLSQSKFTSRCFHPAADAGFDWAQLGFCIGGAGVGLWGGLRVHWASVLLSLNFKPRI